MLYIKPNDHKESRREVHPSQRQLHITPVSQPLYMVTVINNPQRYLSRYKHYQAFEKHMEESGVILYTVELALRDRHHEITSHDNPRHIQLRSESELWHKENLINIGVRHFPPDWHYGGYADADFLFTRPDWATEAIHQLQHYSWVQLFSTYTDLNNNHVPYRVMPSFMNIVKNGELNWTTPRSYSYYKSPLPGATGGAWSFRREAFDHVGGFLDKCIIGSGDWYMSYALANKTNWEFESKRSNNKFINYVKKWSIKAKEFEYKIGYIECHALHYWHGDKSQRGYGNRWEMMLKHDFDPDIDVRYDWQGVLSWSGNKPALEEDLRKYFKSRNEDATS